MILGNKTDLVIAHKKAHSGYYFTASHKKKLQGAAGVF